MSHLAKQETNQCTHASPEVCLQQSPTQYYLYCLPRKIIGDRVDAVPQGEPQRQTGRVAARRLQKLLETAPEKAAKILAAKNRPLQYSLVKDEEAAARALSDDMRPPSIELTLEPAVEKEPKLVPVNLRPTKTQRKQTSKLRYLGGGGGGGYRGR